MNRLIIRCYESSTISDTSRDLLSELPLTEQATNESRVRYGALSSRGDWALMDEKGALLEYQQDADLPQLTQYLAEQSTGKSMRFTDVIVCPPTERLHTRCLSLDSGQRKHLETVAPFLMEETLAQSMEELHFTILNKSQQDRTWVVAVEKTLLSIWIEQLASWQLFSPSILPLACGFMKEAEKQEGHCLLVKVQQENVSPVEGSAVLSPQWLWINDTTVNVLTDSMLTHLPKTAMETAIIEAEPEKRVLEKIAQFVLQTKSWQEKNLCHGAFRQGGLWLEKLTPWRWVAALAVIAFCLELFLLQASTKALGLQEQDVRQQANALFLELVPSEGRVVNLSRQLRGLLQQNPATTTSTKTDSAYDVLAKIDQAREQVKGLHRLTRLDFFDQTYRLDWQAEKRETLDAIQSALEKSALSVQMEQVVRQEQGYRAALKIQLTN
ncbi:type II secretion system protein GspL [Marinomonas sp. 15G1-11]|uniref:Type II secretion system protein L n=1 Tax=Marinomonas phaeophyticola TaxID=3004091 RepID=A0ABT4JT19_9GAMM|nr:type II secretion system protein GspL [Marinomonas sp. 15G1-11]MCZ2721542.1 type II secretion system protein GspL [Marinomonas sp. 15G1-11]